MNLIAFSFKIFSLLTTHIKKLSKIAIIIKAIQMIYIDGFLVAEYVSKIMQKITLRQARSGRIYLATEDPTI